MEPTPVIVIAEWTAKAGREDEARQLLLALLQPTRKEEGCILYDLHEVSGPPAQFVFYENWSSAEALDAHLKSPHLAPALAQITELFSGTPRVLICRRIG